MRKAEEKLQNRPLPESCDTADLNGRLIMNFRDISHTMRCLYEGKGSQKRILIVLQENERMTQRELTQWLNIQPGSVSEVIAKLENAGLILRSPSTRDRRTTDISLTEEGKRQADVLVSQRDKRHEQMFSGLSQAEKTRLLALLEKVNRDWETRYRNVAETKEQEHEHGRRRRRAGQPVRRD